jgi:hypothetical protein
MKKKIIKSAVILSAGLMLSPVFGQATVSGTVYDSESQPGAEILVPLATVELQTVTLPQAPGGDTTYTSISDVRAGFEGEFEFTNVENGDYSLLVTKERYNPTRTAVSVTGGQDQTLEIRLAQIPYGTLWGIVKAGGFGVFAAKVDLYLDGEFVTSETSTSNGMYFFYDGLKIGLTYEVRVSYDGHEPQTAMHTQETSEDQLDFSLVAASVDDFTSRDRKSISPVVYIKSGVLSLRNMEGNGALTLIGLDGTRIWHTHFDSDTRKLAFPAGIFTERGIYLVSIKMNENIYRQQLVIP